MKITLQLPFPDHHAKSAFEFLIGWGYVGKIDAMQGTFEYEIESVSPQALMRLIAEDVNEVDCYGYWDKPIMPTIFEQAQAQIDALDLGLVRMQMNKREQKELIKLVNRLRMSRATTPPLEERERNLLDKLEVALKSFEPLVIHPVGAVA